MLSRLIRFSINQAALVAVMALIAVGFAAYQTPRMAVDVFPELNAPTVVIISESPGYAADEVEQYVTFPIESAVNGLPGVRRVRSGSAIGMSIVWVEFDWGVDIYRARYLVSERLAIAEESIPDGVHSEMTPVTSITGEIMLMSVSSPDGSADAMELRAYAEFELRNHLLAVPGISQVVAIGGELPEYQVNVRQEELRLYGLTIDDVIEAARAAHSTAGAGYLTNVEGLEIPLRQTGRVRGEQDIRDTIIRYHEGAAVTIGQVADVRLGPAPRRGTASEGGSPAVVLTIQKAPGTNTLALTRAIDDALAQLTLPEGMRVNPFAMRQSDFINLSLDNVISVARDAAIIVAIILALFLMNLRTTIITLVAIPLSIAATLLIMWWMGETINVMTLGGLAVAIGIVVDDGIIFVENIHRRLKENDARPTDARQPKKDVIFLAAREILGSVIFATVIIVIVFVPLLFLQGLEGRFFRPLGEAYMIAVGASLLVAITVTVALCQLLLRAKPVQDESKRPKRAARDSVVVRFLKWLYAPTLRIVLRLRLLTVASAVILTVLSLWLASTFGTSFLPEFNEGTFTVFVMAPPGTSLEESDRLAHGIEERLTEINGVRHVVRRTGRAERDEHAEPVSNSEIEVTVEPGFSKEQVRAEIQKVLAGVPKITTMIGQPIEHRLSHILSGTPAAIAINVYGDDLSKLRSIAQEIERELKTLSGATDVAANREVMIVSLPVRYRLGDLKQFGLAPAAAADQVQDLIFGETVATVNEGSRRYDIVVRLAPEDRETIDDVRNLILHGEGGTLMRLHEVADIGRERASNLIARENAQRKAVVSLNLAEGYNLGQLVMQVQQRVDPIVRKAGYRVNYGGQFEAQQSALRTILVMGAIVVVVILILLNMSLGSTRAALLVLVNLPLALIGGIAAIFFTEVHDPFNNVVALFGLGAGRYEAPVISIASMVGFITLFGIAVRNGILLVNHYAHLRREEGLSIHDAVMRGSMERLVPILMTALTAVLGLLPLALAHGEPGSELLAPLAIVVLGGLVTSTFLNLVVVPAGYAIIFGATDMRADRSGKQQQHKESSS